MSQTLIFSFSNNKLIKCHDDKNVRLLPPPLTIISFFSSHSLSLLCYHISKLEFYMHYETIIERNIVYKSPDKNSTSPPFGRLMCTEAGFYNITK